jgi:hypothetical protein
MKKISCSFILDDNDIQGGETMGLYIQEIADPDKMLNKTCIIKIYEVDVLAGKKKETTSDDLLAIFESMICEDKEGKFYFDNNQTRRTDSFDKEFPKPKMCSTSYGKPLPMSPAYKPVHFYLFLDAEESKYDTHLILIKSETTEIELFTYEIGFTVEIENKIIYDSRKIPAYIECSNILADNCIKAANFLIEKHNKHKEQHLCGTHYGSMFPYKFINEGAYIKAMRRVNPSVADKFKGTWDPEYKELFDKHCLEYKLTVTDCIDFVINILEMGFTNSDMKNEWGRCKKHLGSKVSGQTLAKCLTDLGWVAIYYAPDANNFYDKDLNKTHTYSYIDAIQYQQYGNNIIRPIVPLHDMCINYSPTTIYEDNVKVMDPTIPEQDKIEQVMNIPFAFLLAKYGGHVALLIKGKVYEVHWTASPYSDNLFGTSKSFLFDHTTDTWNWMSGIIVTPKVFWKKSITAVSMDLK